MGAVGAKGEIGDDQHLAVDVGERQIHFVVGVGKDAQSADFIREHLRFLFVVSLRHAEQYQKALAHLADGFSVYGNGIMNHVFDGYEPFKGEIVTRHQGSLIAFETGDSVTYGLYAAQERGRLFIGAGVPVYEGMIVGASPKSEDITVNVCKKKHITNTRASGSDDALKLTPPTIMSLEQCLEFIADDELVEVTPENIRMRKRILSKEQRMKQAFRKKQS